MFAPTFNRKEFCTTQAEAARAGAMLQHIEADDGKPLLVLSRDAFTGQFTSLSDVQRVLSTLTAEKEVAHV
ncbi:hypothetical protein [Hydrogenophaga atypica]|uniref:Prevent-host-death protein n=1 Tax=Hydrogenophaga atypica TaxID=249409 RepID=A0ABW2QSN9_9BURK